MTDNGAWRLGTAGAEIVLIGLGKVGVSLCKRRQCDFEAWSTTACRVSSSSRSSVGTLQAVCEPLCQAYNRRAPMLTGCFLSVPFRQAAFPFAAEFPVDLVHICVHSLGLAAMVLSAAAGSRRGRAMSGCDRVPPSRSTLPRRCCGVGERIHAFPVRIARLLSVRRTEHTSWRGWTFMCGNGPCIERMCRRFTQSRHISLVFRDPWQAAMHAVGRRLMRISIYVYFGMCNGHC